jgi:hypothetical protein
MVPESIRICCQDAGTIVIDPVADGPYIAQRLWERGYLRAIDAWCAWAGRDAVVAATHAAWPDCHPLARCLAVWRLGLDPALLPSLEDCRAWMSDPFLYPAGIPTPEADAASAERDYALACQVVPGTRPVAAAPSTARSDA